MEKETQSFKQRFPLFLAYSAIIGAIALFFTAYAEAKSQYMSMYFVSPLSVKGIVAFVGGFIIAYLLLFIFANMNNKTGKVYRYIDSLLMHPLTLLVLAIICWRLYYYSAFNNHTIYYDTPTYVNYSANIFLGQVDKFRTPIYPWFLKLIGFVTHSETGSVQFYTAISTAQRLLSFCGALLIYSTANRIFKSKLMISAVTLIYGIAPAVISWDMCILTESLSLFATTLCIWLIMYYIEKPSKPLAIIMGFYALIMVLLRPTFIYMFAILGVFFVARFIFTRKDRKRAVLGLVSLLCSGLLLVGYCGLNKKENDCFAISSVGVTVNQLYIVIAHNMYDNPDFPVITQYITDKRTNAEPNQNIIIEIVEPAGQVFQYSELADYVNSCIKNHQDEYNEYSINEFKNNFNSNIAVQYSTMTDAGNVNFRLIDNVLLHLTFPFTFGGCFAIVIASVIFALYEFIRRKQIAWQVIGLSAIVFTHIFVSIYASMAEYSRLSIMVVPAVYLLVFWYADTMISSGDIQKSIENKCEPIELFSIKPLEKADEASIEEADADDGEIIL